jgi:4-hydroxybenzoate polyprenyltransferase
MPTSSAQPSPPSLLRSYCQLLRLPNVFTAVADVAMGFLVVQGTWFPTTVSYLGRGNAVLLGMLVVASALLYGAGVVLNDLFDLPRDRIERPERPLPSGRISPRAARWLGGEMLLAGVLISCAVAQAVQDIWPGVIGTTLAITIVLYDTVLKRTPLGPLAMGACRALNVLLGMSVLPGMVSLSHAHAPGTWQHVHLLFAAAIGLYVAGITWLARNEAGRSKRLHLIAATLVMLAGIGLLAVAPRWLEELVLFGHARPWLLRMEPWRWWSFIAVIALWLGGWCFRAIVEPTAEDVQLAVGRAIMMLVILDTAACCVVRGPFWAFRILLLLLPASLLSRWIQST